MQQMQPAAQPRPVAPPAPRAMPEPVAPAPVAMDEPDATTAAVEVVTEESAYTPRVIPPHLRQPLRPQAPKAPSSSRGTGLFAEAPRAETQPPPPPRRSLFGIMTGAFRGASAAIVPHSAEEPTAHSETLAHEAPEPLRASVRPTGGDDIALDIPAFLRRQTS
jgi:cell division protein FtsZ